MQLINPSPDAGKTCGNSLIIQPRENGMKWITELLTKWLLCLAASGTAVCLAWEEPKITRPQLQIINGSSQTVDVFWLQSDNERVANGSIAPGKNTIIGTTIGHRFI